MKRLREDTLPRQEAIREAQARIIAAPMPPSDLFVKKSAVAYGLDDGLPRNRGSHYAAP
ncbi:MULTISPECIES: hypothetical protein [Burkholderia]|jgi:hypothetical protein|uniref:hypothetical protein n=1 Tax=Burkholderia TaxID=32008 RepID=UPI0012DC40F2|nr:MULTISPECIES: hypothetical protein [Burkholderia cepacia complex]HEP6285309.1 hypothetical protein [Burkholderia vietnamiensis]MBR8393988.1 hypothetical protein [Burkholderia cenocepacia]MBX3979332.1 hypothetical protein [Burkholderia cepacia]MBX4011140.1 hypothetical protein [Burkholderia cepacia]MBX4024377.1 hypothetical protein [Burkholderia cepacia]